MREIFLLTPICVMGNLFEIDYYTDTDFTSNVSSYFENYFRDFAFNGRGSLYFNTKTVVHKGLVFLLL